MKQILNTLYVQTQGAYLRLERETLKVEIDKELKLQIPLHHLGGIFAFGNVLFSPFLIHKCAEDGKNLVWLNEYGKFKARVSSATTGNVFLRQAQHRAVNCSEITLAIACQITAAKIQNAHVVLKRASREANSKEDKETLSKTAQAHTDSIANIEDVSNLEKLRGIEGYAAKTYFGSFTKMVRQNRDTFAFTQRTRKPPRDPVNALLSFTYTLLLNDCISACEGIGLDPQLGFIHAIRPGKPSLALDLMEELRSPLADRLVLTLINQKQIKPNNFVERPGGAIYLNEAGKKTLLTAYQKRKQEEIKHTILDSKIPFGLVPHIQARLLARYLREDVSSYQPFVLRG